MISRLSYKLGLALTVFLFIEMECLENYVNLSIPWLRWNIQFISMSLTWMTLSKMSVQKIILHIVQELLAEEKFDVLTIYGTWSLKIILKMAFWSIKPFKNWLILLVFKFLDLVCLFVQAYSMSITVTVFNKHKKNCHKKHIK